jgi:type IV pilus assembly protein PilW
MILRKVSFSPSALIRGFSLVELMVGIVIALISSLAIVQVFSTYEGQKRSTTAGSEAQENGLMALVQMEQDIHNAGAGVTDSNTLSCTTNYTYLDAPTDSPIPNFSLDPVSVTDGASNASDTVSIRTGSNFLGSIPSSITKPMPSSSSEFNVDNPSVFTEGDLSIVMQGGNCTIQNITTVQTASKKIQHNPGNSAPNNPPNSWKNTYAWPGYSTGAKVKSLGTITARTYSISNSNLQMVSTNVASNVSATAETLAKDIVNMQVQYGVASSGSQIVDTWVNPTGGTWATPTAANVQRIKAIRLVIVARSGKKENANVTNTCTNNGGTNNGPCAWRDTGTNPAPLIDLSGDTDWRKYRYKVYQTIIPLRNVIWANV